MAGREREGGEKRDEVEGGREGVEKVIDSG